MKSLYAVGLVSAFSMVGCFGNGGEGGDKGPVPIEEMGQEVAVLICEIFDTCVGPGFIGADCVNQFTANFEDSTQPQMQDAIDRGTLDYDAGKMRDCLDAMAGAGCEAIGDSSAPAVCDEAMVGSVAPSGGCFIDEECAGNAYCDDLSTCPGLCEDYLGLNDDCSTDGRCDGGLQCFNGLCAQPSQLNQSCGAGTHPYCDSGLECVGEIEVTPGTCTARPALTLAGLDETCDPQEGLFCHSGLSCAMTALSGGEIPVWTCKAGVASGAACFIAVPDQCVETEYCDGQISPANLQGLCAALPGENAPCAEGLSGSKCLPGLECVAIGDGMESCFRPRRLTDPCSTDQECVSGLCDPGSSTCAVPECG